MYSSLCCAPFHPPVQHNIRLIIVLSNFWWVTLLAAKINACFLQHAAMESLVLSDFVSPVPSCVAPLCCASKKERKKEEERKGGLPATVEPNALYLQGGLSEP